MLLCSNPWNHPDPFDTAESPKAASGDCSVADLTRAAANLSVFGSHIRIETHLQALSGCRHGKTRSSNRFSSSGEMSQAFPSASGHVAGQAGG